MPLNKLQFIIILLSYCTSKIKCPNILEYKANANLTISFHNFPANYMTDQNCLVRQNYCTLSMGKVMMDYNSEKCLTNF